MRGVSRRKLTSAPPVSSAEAPESDEILACVFPSVPQCAAGGNGSVVVERGVQAFQESDCTELLPQRVPGPAHPGCTHSSKHMCH